MTSFSRGGTAALAAVLLAAPVTGAQIVAARDTPRFYGTWRLVSETQTGMMIYDSLGNMAAQVMPNRLRRKYAAAEPTPEEAKAAITGYLAYFGTYTVDDPKTFTKAWTSKPLWFKLLPDTEFIENICDNEKDVERIKAAR